MDLQPVTVEEVMLEQETPPRMRGWTLLAVPRLGLRVFKRAAGNFLEDRGTQMAAAISYYTLFSLFPLTLLAVSVFGIVLRDAGVQERVLNEIIAFLPIQEGAIANSLRGVAELGATLTVVSLLGSLWSAGAVAASVRSALSVVFGVRRRRPMLRGKMIDYVLLLIIGLPLIGGVVLTGIWRLAQVQISQVIGLEDGGIPFAWNAGALLIPGALSFVAFLFTYWLVPNRPLSFRYLWPGALFAAVGFEGLKGGFALYLQHFGNYDVIYGSLGSVIILLFWLYLTAAILIFGAEIAAEVPYAAYEEPEDDAAKGSGRHPILGLLRGLVMAGDDPDDADEPPRTARARRRASRQA